jgi:hypothetical protein
MPGSFGEIMPTVLAGVLTCEGLPTVNVESAGEAVVPVLVILRTAGEAAVYGGGGLVSPSERRSDLAGASW